MCSYFITYIAKEQNYNFYPSRCSKFLQNFILKIVKKHFFNFRQLTWVLLFEGSINGIRQLSTAV